jgi:HEAT repeat protein
MSLLPFLLSAFAATPADVLSAAAPEAVTTPTAELRALRADPDWRVRARVAAALTWREDLATAEKIDTVAPITTRTGAIRYTDRALATPAAAPLLIERALAAQDPVDRAALAAALPQTGGDWSDAVAGMLADEPAAVVRVQLAEALREATPAAAWTGLALAAVDPAAEVRAAAWRAMANRADASEHGGLVLSGLSDRDSNVRALAIRAAGWLRLSDAWTPIVALLSDADADVRLQALRALERLDAGRARVLPEVVRLRGDTDPRVARAATHL